MFNFLKKKKEPQDIEEVLNFLKRLEEENKEIKREISKIKEENSFFIKKKEVIRYNPFSEMGGNQSFSALLLDKNNDGIMISGLYTENGSRVYAKSIKEGVSNYSLSKEESVLLEETIKKDS